MKSLFIKILLGILLLVVAGGNYSLAVAGGETPAATETQHSSTPSAGLGADPTTGRLDWNSIQSVSNLDAGGPTTIITSEKVPGAVCTCVAPGAQDNVPGDGVGPVLPGKGEAACGDITTRKYKCIVQPGLQGFQNVFAQIIRTIVYIVMLLGVLAVVGLGIAWAWAGGDDVKMKSSLKHWAINVLIGLTILFLFRYILAFLAPWIYK